MSSLANLPTVGDLLAAPHASDWLKNCLRSALDRDPLDAAADANILARVLGAAADAKLAADLARLGIKRPDAT